MRTIWIGCFLVGCLGATARAEGTTNGAPAPRRIAIELTTLNLLRDKKVITEAEYDSAVHDLGESVGTVTGEAPTLVLGKWSTTLYGFVEADHIFDTTQSFNDSAGNNAVARNGTYLNQNARFMFGARNSRIGLRLRAPEWHHMRASAMLEMDFLGNQPPTVTEAQFWTNPTFRFRHMNLKIETPIVDILIGQYWQLFGWQSTYHPNTVEIQGVPGQLYSRTPQIRLSHSFKTKPVVVEIAAAIMRPPQRDSGYPEGQAGVRVAFPVWNGYYTTGATGSTVQPLSLAVTGDLRRFALPEFSANPGKSIDSIVGLGIAVDALVPIIPATKEHRRNALSLNGEYAWTQGAADLYTGLTGGVTFPALPNLMPANPAPVYLQNVDNGLAVIDPDNTVHLIVWQSFLIGIQYYWPVLDGRIFISGNYSHIGSNNSQLHGAANRVFTDEDWFDVNLFGDVTPAVRIGLEYAYFRDKYADGNVPVNNRVQLSAFYIF
jgi:hypothetical protein